ncbi:LecA/PA-IL family lectin [Caballeronia sp. M23-90]
MDRIPSANEAALLGRIGSGEWFVIGSSLQRTCEADGDLVVQMNDLRGAYHDNAGSMQVTYSIEPGQV